MLITIKIEAQDDPFMVQSANVMSPSLPEGAPGYSENGSFEISISDGASCTGYYDIIVIPDVNSSLLGNTPSFATPNVVFNAAEAGSPYLFNNVGAGTYTVQVFEFRLCGLETNPEVITATVPDTVPIPTLFQWGILSLALFMLIVGTLSFRVATVRVE